MVNIHQQPKHKSKFSNAVKFLLMLAALALLIFYKNWWYAFQEEKAENSNPTGSIIHNTILSSEGQNPSVVVPTTPPSSQQLMATATPPAEPSVIGKLKVTITPTGYLNVRSQPSLAASILTKVLPNSEYNYIAVQNNWYEINLTASQTGWVWGGYITSASIKPSVKTAPLPPVTASPPIIRRHDDDRE